jgi:hypothetical protein
MNAKTQIFHPQNEFSIQEHLKVQRQIERCAYQFWLACGKQTADTLTSWLQAEVFVVKKFIRARATAPKKTHKGIEPIVRSTRHRQRPRET